MTFCANCGAARDAAHRFCPACGQTFAPGPQNETAASDIASAGAVFEWSIWGDRAFLRVYRDRVEMKTAGEASTVIPTRNITAVSATKNLGHLRIDVAGKRHRFVFGFTRTALAEEARVAIVSTLR